MRKEHLLKKYIKEHKLTYCFIIIWILIFMLVFRLMDISLSVIHYPFFLCVTIFLVITLFDFLHYKEEHEKRIHCLEAIDVTIENLPVGKSLAEQDYRMLLQELMNRKNTVIFQEKNARENLLSYTTIWTHQIKTPLTALQLMCSDLENPLRSDMLARLFEIEQYGDMMLQYLRLEGEQGDYVFKEYSVKSMVNQAVKYYARIFISKGIMVNVQIPDDSTVVTDEKWMVFVLKQIISNSLKYTKKGRITITQSEGGILICDTGIGIAPEELPRIMERGYTGYNGRKDKKATGIGLYLVNQILGKLNHDIRITSKVNEGTQVEIIFNITKS